MQDPGKFFHSFLASVGESLMVTDEEGKIVAVNEELTDFLGYEEEELIGKAFLTVLIFQDSEKAFYLYKQSFSRAEGEKISSNWLMKRRDGKGVLVPVSFKTIKPEGKEKYLITTIKKFLGESYDPGFYKLQKKILQNVKESVVVVRVDGTILYWNQGASEIYEFGEEEVVGKLIYQFWPEERFSQLVQYFKFGNEKLDLFDSPHIRKDGKKRYVDFHITPLFDEKEDLEGLIFVSQDVTERYQNKKANREQRNMLASLIDSQSNFLVRLDTEGKLSFMNKAFLSHTNFLESIEGEPFENHVHPKEVKLWRSVLKKAKDTLQLQKVELRMLTETKEQFWVSWEWIALTDKKGRVNYLQGVGSDISDRKKVELDRDKILLEMQALNQELQASEEELRQNLESTLELKANIERNERKFKSLLENSFEVVIVFDEKGCIQYSSPSVQSILGFSPEEMIGKKAMYFVHEEDKPQLKTLLKEVMSNPAKPVYILHRARKKTGGYIYIESYSTNLLNDENVKGIVSNYRDITGRREAEERLRNSEASLNLAQHIAKFGSVEFDLLSGEVRQSTGLYAIYDFDLTKHKENEFIGYDYIHPEDVEKVRDFFVSQKEYGPEWVKDVKYLPEKRLEQLEKFPFEYRIISAAGKLKHIKSNSRVIRDEKGRPVKNIVTIQDVSEEKHLERMLEDTNYMAKIGGWELNLETQKYFGTTQTYRMLRLPLGTQIPLGDELKLFHPDHQALIERSVQDLISKGVPFDLELIMVTAENERFWARIIGRAEKVNDQVVLVKGIIQDITERKNAEKEIQNYADRLRLATETAGIGIWDWDLQQEVIDWDEQMRKIYQVPLDKPMKYEDWKKTVYPVDLPRFEANWPNIMENKKSESEYRIVLPSGDVKWIKSFSQIFKDKNGKARRMVGVNWDITRLKQTEETLRANNEELLKTNDELDHFVYSTSHNLRAPLTSILGIVGLMKNYPDPEGFSDYINLIEKSVQKLDGTIKEITNYSRNARVVVAAEQIAFEPLIREMRESLLFLENAAKISWSYKVIPPDFRFYSDESRVKMIFNNLLSNAVKYADFGKENPYINIKVEQEQEGVFISIKDNGIGIAPEYQEKVFDMFYRASTRSTGSGLGLYIVKEALHKLNGTIKMISIPGEGTEFRIYIPAMQGPGEEKDKE